MLRKRRNCTHEDWIRSSRETCEQIAGEINLRDDTNVLIYYPAPDEFEIDLRYLLSSRRNASDPNWLLPRVIGSKNCLKIHRMPELNRFNPDDEHPVNWMENQQLPLVSGKHGIPEPDPDRCPAVKRSDVDLVFVPGLAFDRRGYRVGYGGGYYDRLLSKLPASTLSVGVCYDFQLVNRVPVEPHDRSVKRVVSNTEFIEVDNSGA